MPVRDDGEGVVVLGEGGHLVIQTFVDGRLGLDEFLGELMDEVPVVGGFAGGLDDDMLHHEVPGSAFEVFGTEDEAGIGEPGIGMIVVFIGEPDEGWSGGRYRGR
jgi:hypothetical protein